jgi:plasmid stabilization system protein ParE
LRCLRVWPLPGYTKILAFYEISAADVTVVRVLHGARDLPTTLKE